MQQSIVIFGAGGHGKVILEAIRAAGTDTAVVLLDDHSVGGALLGEPIVGGRDWLLENCPDAAVVPAIGSNAARAELIEWLAAQGRALATVIHPAATVSPSAEIGGGTFIAAGAVVNAEARIGEGVIVNTMASVDHDCEIGASAHIAPGSRLCGGVRVGPRALLGAGSIVIPKVSIGADAVVGAGSVVLRDVPPRARIAGCPARPI